jgi:propionyl-CoA carboxylase alpha chain
MAQALDAFVIRGVNHNIGFLAAIMGRDRFASGKLSTDFIPTEFPDGFHGAELSVEAADQLVSLAAIAQHRLTTRALAAAPGAHKPAVPSEWTVLIGPPPRQARQILVEAGTDDAYTVTLDGVTRQVLTAWMPGTGLFEAKIDGAGLTVQIDRAGTVLTLFRAGAATEMRVVSRAVGALAGLMPVKVPPDLSKFLLSPMPGLLVSIAVTEGQDVKAGEELAVVEAMKMENVLRAERDGKVKKIAAAARESLAVDQVIIEFE